MLSNRVIVGVTGASGVIMAYHLLKALKNEKIESHLVVSDSAKLTWKNECGISMKELGKLAYKVYDNTNVGAAIASGSFITKGMIIIPCSMKTLSCVANGYSDNLILRAADVCIKENRKFVIVPREMPLSRIHLKNLIEIVSDGGIVIPPMLTFYNGEKTIDDQINDVIGKILLQFGIRYNGLNEWNPKV